MEKISRRDFLITAALAGVGSMIIPGNIIRDRYSIGIQLYTLRDLMNDPEIVLMKLGEMGYQEVETFGYSDGKYFGMSPKDYKSLLTRANLNPVSGHYGTGKINPETKGTMSNGWLMAVDDAEAIGQIFMVLAWLYPQERVTIDDYKRHAELLNKCGEECKKRGIQMAYHNHDFEFIPINNTVPFDVLLNETDPDLVKFELDLYWAAKVNVDPVKLFKDSPGRYPLVHVKDMDESGDFAPVGTGVIEFKRIFDNSGIAGIKHYFVEQDKIEGDKWEAVKTSFRNIQRFM